MFLHRLFGTDHHWTYRIRMIPWGIALLLSMLVYRPATAQFLDEFDGPALSEEWTFLTGDGEATMDFRQGGDGYASVFVDATQDRHNIWWALIKHEVTDGLNLRQLSRPGYELRIEARIRSSHAPRRVNLHLNTQKTVDFHSHLMEFDIPDTVNWHTISMTTRDFDAGPGDTVNGQLALMDWGPDKYRVDLDYFRVEVVEAATAGPDQGEPLPYHPPIPDPDTFSQQVDAVQCGMIDLQYPDMNFNAWYTTHEGGKNKVLTVNGTQYVILRWDLQSFAGKQVDGMGLLELTTYSVQRMKTDLEELGTVRVVEILGADPHWTQETVTHNSFTQGQSLDEVVNGQMIIDVEVTEGKGGKTYIILSRPVLQRLLDGKTLGLILRPLGPIHATFYAPEHAGGKFSPKLYFNTTDKAAP